MSHIVYPPDAKVVIDVTKAPYFLDPTGQADCTAQLLKMLDELALHSVHGMRELQVEISKRPETNFTMAGSFENGRMNGVDFGIFPIRMPPSHIFWFPKGTYLVSDTICYTTGDLQNLMGSEMNWCIRFQGESRTETIIKLKDHCPGFGYGENRPVLRYMRGLYSNVAMSNYCRNLTIDTGSGNPGAVGLDFFGNNSAAVRELTIRSGDGKGSAGLTLSRPGASGCVFDNIEIEGFDYGMKLQEDCYVTGGDITLKHQNIRGLFVKECVVSLRGLKSENSVPAVSVSGHATHVAILEADLKGGDSDAPAFEHRSGQLIIRDISTTGYGSVVGMMYTKGWGTEVVVPGQNCQEWVSGGVCTLSPDQPKSSLGLKPEPLPVMTWDHDFSHWTHPGQYGAMGDGVTDDTEAIQKAMDSGLPIIYFQPGRYRINAPILIPASVKRINFCFVDLISGPLLHDMHGAGMFTVAAESADPLLMEDLFSFEENFGHHYLIEHASQRTLILRDLHSQACASYRKSVPGGTVFMDNVVCTNGIRCDRYQQPSFVFLKQKAWCRQLDPEYTLDKIINDGSDLFILGMKTEGHGIAIITKNGGRTELFGGWLLFGANDGTPIFLNDHSEVAVSVALDGTTSKHLYDVAVREIFNGVTREVRHELFPRRIQQQYFIPLYVGRSSFK